MNGSVEWLGITDLLRNDGPPWYLEKLKTDNGQEHVHEIFWRCTYMQPSSIALISALAVEPPSVEMTDTYAGSVT